MKVSDLGSILEFQTLQSDGSWLSSIHERGNFKLNSGNDRSRAIIFNTEIKSKSYKLTIRYRDDITRSMRVLANGKFYTIGCEPEPDSYEYKQFLTVDVFQEESEESISAIAAYGREAVLLIPNTAATNDSPAFDRKRNGDTPAIEKTIKVLQTQFETKQIDGSRIMNTDIRYLISGDVVLSSAMSIRDGNQTYKIVNVEEIKPGNDNLIHIVQAR